MASLEEVKSYLDSVDIPYSSVQSLSGGTGNFLWRVIQTPRKSFVIKHAKPYVASNPTIPFAIDRMTFEATELAKLPSVLPADEVVRMPKLEKHDEHSHMLIEDGGEGILKEVYTNPSINISATGTHLGNWLANLHSTTAESSNTNILRGDNKTARSIYRFAYSRLSTALRIYGLDPTLGEEVNEQFGALLATDDDCLCHGDFWPGNVLVSPTEVADVPASETVEQCHVRAMVVDWEMTRRGCGATDVRQFAAEAYLLDRFRGRRGLLDAFVRAYITSAQKLSSAFSKRVAIHFGVHLAFWPTVVKWTDEAGTREVVRLGATTLQSVLNEDLESLAGGPLSVLFS